MHHTVTTTTIEDIPTPPTKGSVLHGEARYYDLLAGLLTLGRERQFRERVVQLARLEPGESVLDVGCGTGTLAIAAKRRVGTPGMVIGIDASAEMIERAKRKAAKAGVDVAFKPATAEALPFPDASFDAVVCTLMLHHLPRPARQQCAREIARVLKPGGRVLTVDFETAARERKGVLARLHRHGYVALTDIVELLSKSGLTLVESGSLGVSDLRFALATAPGSRADDRQDGQAPATRSLDPLPAPRWLLIVPGIALVAGHAIVLRVASSRLALSAVTMAAVAGLLVIAHSRFRGLVNARTHRRAPR